MEVRQVRDPDAVELSRNAIELDLEDPLSQPSSFEPPPQERADQDDPETTTSQVTIARDGRRAPSYEL